VIAGERERKNPVDLSQQQHRRLIGYLGLVLPGCLYLVAGWRPTPALPTWELLPSVSAYYYSGAVALFTGVLSALSLFLLTYRGYEGVRADRVVGIASGAAAACVALFPTAAPAGLELAWWRRWMGYTHLAAAVVLFASFIVFALWLFRLTAVVDRSQRPADKKRRDAVCLACGLVMLAAVVWAAIAGVEGRSIFWPEAIAIEAFAVSWLTKGEAHKPLVKVSRHVVRRIAGRPGMQPSP
jgi:hypothetical protein